MIIFGGILVAQLVDYLNFCSCFLKDVDVCVLDSLET